MGLPTCVDSNCVKVPGLIPKPSTTPLLQARAYVFWPAKLGRKLIPKNPSFKMRALRRARIKKSVIVRIIFIAEEKFEIRRPSLHITPLLR
jgi:hypothetical protein